MFVVWIVNTVLHPLTPHECCITSACIFLGAGFYLVPKLVLPSFIVFDDAGNVQRLWVIIGSSRSRQEGGGAWFTETCTATRIHVRTQFSKLRKATVTFTVKFDFEFLSTNVIWNFDFTSQRVEKIDKYSLKVFPSFYFLLLWLLWPLSAEW